MLFTGTGDDGKMKTFGCDQRISKSSAVAEALGALDEINSFLGLCKVKSQQASFEFAGTSIGGLMHDMQNCLFIVQAQLAGASKQMATGKVKEMEQLIQAIEKELPPIRTFFISGGTEMAALFDVARTMARRAERRLISATETDKSPVSVPKESKAFMNRLSSVLYALARLSNHKSGIKEEPPRY